MEAARPGLPSPAMNYGFSDAMEDVLARNGASKMVGPSVTAL
jgi:hypothetical protein